MFNKMLRSLALTLLATAAVAQIRLPVAPRLPQPLSNLDRPVSEAASRTLGTLSELRQREIDQLVRNNRQRIDTDPQGNPIVRNEVLAWLPSDDVLARARSLGFRVMRQESLESLQVRLVVLGAPSGVATRNALKLLKSAAPAGSYDFNHIYLGSAAQSSPLAAGATAPAIEERAAGASFMIRIGLLDTGVNVRHPALASARIVQWGCGGRPVAAAHGTAVASILIGRGAGFQGVRPEAALYSADVYCGEPTGGAADALIGALGWLFEQRVPTINVSLVGPANLLMEHTISALTARGFLIVAAVGNDGPAAAPLYPASYPGVVGVSAVDVHQQVLMEAARGPQVMFAAPGADMAAANGAAGFDSVRGTSFASPIVAALLAGKIDEPDPLQARAAVDALSRIALHRGSAGRDLTYGFGVVGTEYRIDPAKFMHQ